MLYTSKIALLAVALFGTSALAAPIASEMEYGVEAREVNDDLSAREFYDMDLEARADSSLDARDLESLDFEAREYLDYLEARQIATAATTKLPQTPPQSSQVQVHASGYSDNSTSPLATGNYLTKHQKQMLRAKKAAAKLFKTDPNLYQTALGCKDHKYHVFAVSKYLKDVDNLKKALGNPEGPLYNAAKGVLHKRKAKVYLADKTNFMQALKDSLHKYHKDAVKKYFKHGDNFEHALAHKKALFHKSAVHEYLLDPNTRKNVLADQTHQFYEMALKVQKMLTGSAASSNATVTSTSPSTAAAKKLKAKY